MLMRLLILIVCCELTFFSLSQVKEEIIVPEGIKSSMDSLKHLEGKYWSEGDEVQGMYVRHELLTKYSNYLSEEDKATWYTKAGESYFHLGNYLLANEFFVRSIGYKNDRLEAYTESRIGSSFIQLKELDSAVVHYRKAIRLAKTPAERMPHMNSLGYVYFLKEEWAASENMFNKALEFFENHNSVIDSIQYLIVKSNEASLLSALERNKEALAVLQHLETLDCFKRETGWFKHEVYQKFTEFYVKENDCTQARNYNKLLDAYVEGDKPNRTYLKYLEVSMSRAKLCGDLNAFSALADAYVVLQEQVREEDRKRLLLIEGLQRSAFEDRIEHFSANLKLKEDSEEILELSNSRLRRLFWISGILFLVITSFVVILYRQKRNRQKRSEALLKAKKDLFSEQQKSAELQNKMAEQQMENKKLELSRILNTIDKSSSLSEEVVQRLTKLKEKEGDIREDLSQLLQFIKSLNRQDQMDELVDTNTDMLGEGFKEKIEKSFPDLTGSELQLVILIKLGLSNKEMAQLKNVEPSSIRIFKHRLKTKLNLNKGQDLSEYIHSL